MAKDRQVAYSEIFSSVQGEGHYTGVPTSWLRLWGCNLTCEGFGQADPYDKKTWVLPYKTFNVAVEKLEDLPVWHTGCDSSYSWAKEYRKLAHTGTAREIAERIIQVNKSPTNPDGLFAHPKSMQDKHLAFTGGEPMMNQRGIIDVLAQLRALSNAPKFVTIETNGTRPMKEEFADYLEQYAAGAGILGQLLSSDDLELFWSVSPKLSNSGENITKTICPEILAEYNALSSVGQLKYVVDGSDRAWDEVELATSQFREVGVDWPVWIMAVGADLEMQDENAEAVCLGAIDRGYNFSARVHVNIFGNKIGT